MSSAYGGLEPGMMAYIDGRVDPESGDNISQCMPFNPFSTAFEKDPWVWGIVLCERGKAPDALRPRRVYAQDVATVIDTIEGLCGYPEEVMQRTTISSGSITACQRVVSQNSVERVDYHDGKEVARYWQHSWHYEGETYEREINATAHFNVPFEYIQWNDGKREELYPAGTVGTTRTFNLIMGVSANTQTQSIITTNGNYQFPAPRCQTRSWNIGFEAGRY